MPAQHVDRPTQIIMHVARSFPLLRGKLHSSEYNPKEFRPEDLVKISRGWSTAEIHLRNFVLTMWNHGWAKDNGCVFDVFRALSCFDETNRNMLMKWLADPRFPGGYL